LTTNVRAYFCLEGLTIGRLANDLGMSKSGLIAHFGSKEDLQLATIATAGERALQRATRAIEDRLESLRAFQWGGGAH
jgi:AcrR family transcriptional regulator